MEGRLAEQQLAADVVLAASGAQLFEAGQVGAAAVAYQQVANKTSEVYRMLGQCHAESDDDLAAMDCLVRVHYAPTKPQCHHIHSNPACFLRLSSIMTV